MQNLMRGLSLGVDTDNNDPESEGRVEVRIKALGDESPTRWCSVVSVAAGGDRGIFFAPEVDDEVIVAYEEGDFDHAFIIGYPWNPVQMPPTTSPNERIIRSREGHTIRFVDSPENGGSRGALIIQDSHGNAITLSNGVMTLNAKVHLQIQAKTMTIMGRPVSPVGGAI
jgi:uncharacterized protein involved in type VI secretion and phage assembly